jgi:predicted nucleotidyltransferase
MPRSRVARDGSATGCDCGGSDSDMIQIDFSRTELEAICRRRAVKRLALFGSVLRDDFAPESDIDVLVEFDHDTFEGKQIYKIYDELTELFGGRKIDLVEVEFVNRRLRGHILEEAQDVFAA